MVPNNVASYNKANLPYGSVNNRVGNLLLEGFENTPKPTLNNENKNESISMFNNIREQLRRAQNRKVYVNDNKNKEALRSTNNMMSAQGYKLGNQISGYNESGANSINYLCVDK